MGDSEVRIASDCQSDPTSRHALSSPRNLTPFALSYVFCDQYAKCVRLKSNEVSWSQLATPGWICERNEGPVGYTSRSAQVDSQFCRAVLERIKIIRMLLKFGRFDEVAHDIFTSSPRNLIQASYV
jgi:hypothetical protein